MSEISLSEHVDAPRQLVWEVFTDLELFESEIEAVQSIERVDGGDGFGVGTRWRETRTMYGRSATEEMWASAVEAPERYVVEARSNGTRYRTEYRFVDTDAGTQVDVRFGVEPTTAITKLLTPLTMRAMRTSVSDAMAADLRAMKAAAERRA